MKLLLDQNISYKILPSVSVFFPESTHVRIEHLEGKTDGEIWNYAKEQGFAIVTQDADFYEITLLKGFPPKILWLRCGNTSTQNIERLLMENNSAIVEFFSNQEYACLELY
jgi:predicted nuclease of predicted toxin-antitoxin system